MPNTLSISKVNTVTIHELARGTEANPIYYSLEDIPKEDSTVGLHLFREFKLAAAYFPDSHRDIQGLVMETTQEYGIAGVCLMRWGDEEWKAPLKNFIGKFVNLDGVGIDTKIPVPRAIVTGMYIMEMPQYANFKEALKKSGLSDDDGGYMIVYIYALASASYQLEKGL
eukprot:806339-Pyramimonas_sp.AAC.1